MRAERAGMPAGSGVSAPQKGQGGGTVVWIESLTLSSAAFCATLSDALPCLRRRWFAKWGCWCRRAEGTHGRCGRAWAFSKGKALM